MACAAARQESGRIDRTGMVRVWPRGAGRPGTGFRTHTRRLVMSGRKSARGTWASRRLRPLVEALDRRELMSVGGLTNSLGSYVAPSHFGPRITQPAKVVNPHTSIDSLLSTVLGPGLNQVQVASKSLGNSPQAVLKQTVLDQPYVHS